MKIAALVLYALVSTAAQEEFPVCEVCGCPTCELGQFAVGNSNGLIPIPNGLESESPEDFTQISCSFLEFLGLNGQISPEICDSGFRLESSFRSACDCPLLPGFTAMPVSAPVTMAPTTASPTLSPSNSPPTGAPTSFLDTVEFCASDEAVNFDGDIFFGATYAFNRLVNSEDYNPICTCMSDTNLVDVYLVLEEGFISGDTERLAELNAAPASIDHSLGFSCTNQCSTCFDGMCAVVSNTQDQRAVGMMANFSAAELTEDFLLGDEFLERITADPGFVHNIRTCATFVSGEEGEICLDILEWAIPALEPETFPPRTGCAISVNGMSCSTCFASAKPDSFLESPCITADCRNIENGEIIDTCSGSIDQGTGIYRFLTLFTEPFFVDPEPDCSLVTSGAPTPAPQPVSIPPVPMTQAPSEPPIISPTIERCRRLR